MRIEERGCKSRRGGGKKGKMKWKEGRGKTEKEVERRISQISSYCFFWKVIFVLKDVL